MFYNYFFKILKKIDLQSKNSNCYLIHQGFPVHSLKVSVGIRRI